MMVSIASFSRDETQSARRFFYCLSTVISLATVCSILILAFKINSWAIYSDATDGGKAMTSGPFPSAGDDVSLALYPQGLRLSNYKPTLAGASITLTLALGFACLAYFVGQRRRALLLSGWQRAIFFSIVGVASIYNSAMFIVNLLFRVGSARFDPRYRSPSTNFESYGPNAQYDAGTFDLGAWACQVSKYIDGGSRNHVLSTQCMDETITLWVGAALAILGIGLAGIVWMDWHSHRILVGEISDTYDEEYDCEYL